MTAKKKKCQRTKPEPTLSLSMHINKTQYYILYYLSTLFIIIIIIIYQSKQQLLVQQRRLKPCQVLKVVCKGKKK